MFVIAGKEVQRSAACFDISFHNGQVQSAHITATLQHNKRTAQPASTAFKNHIICIVVGQITQYAQY